VCDYSLPILGAMSRAFCNVSLSEYVDKCFICLNKSNKNLPSCYIRIDVSHMVKIFCRLKCLNGKNKHLKVFYVSCFRLLLVSKDIDDFREILTNILTVLLSETDGWLDKLCTKPNPSEQSRVYLVNRIKDIPIQDEVHEINFDLLDDVAFNEDSEENVASGFDECPNRITTFLEDVLKTIKDNSEQKGNRLSAHSLPELTTDILRICKHFPLWTSVMQSLFNSPYDIATSGSVEGDFKDLKCHILHFERKPMTVDRFVIKHLNSINSNARLFKSSQIRNSAKINKQEISVKGQYTKNTCSVEKTKPLDNIDDCIQHDKDIYIPSVSKSIWDINDSFDEEFDKEINDMLPNVVSDKKPEKSESEKSDSKYCCIQDETSDDNSITLSTSQSDEEYENWRGLGRESQEIYFNDKPKRQRITKYMQANKDIELSFNKRKTRSNFNSLLLNGNLSSIVYMEK